MLLESLAQHHCLEDASQWAAGNWRHWTSFVWWGSDDIPHSEDVMLGYLVNHECTLRQLTNMEYVRKELDPWWGDMTEGALVGDYYADFWGDQKMLAGLMVRVYADGEITQPFKRLYEVSRELRWSNDAIVDWDTFSSVRLREFRRYVHDELEYECGERGVEFSEELVRSIVQDLILNEVDFDNDDVSTEISLMMGWETDDDLAE